MNKLRLLLICGIAVLFMSSCHTYRHSMREPNAIVRFDVDDFEISEQVVGKYTAVRVLGINWKRLFHSSKVAGTSVVGEALPIPTGANYALYDMMEKNPGYDVVVYPQVETHRHAPVLGTDIYSKTTYKVTARLGKLKTN